MPWPSFIYFPICPMTNILQAYRYLHPTIVFEVFLFKECNTVIYECVSIKYTLLPWGNTQLIYGHFGSGMWLNKCLSFCAFIWSGQHLQTRVQLSVLDWWGTAQATALADMLMFGSQSMMCQGGIWLFGVKSNTIILKPACVQHAILTDHVPV